MPFLVVLSVSFFGFCFLFFFSYFCGPFYSFLLDLVLPIVALPLGGEGEVVFKVTLSESDFTLVVEEGDFEGFLEGAVFVFSINTLDFIF